MYIKFLTYPTIYLIMPRFFLQESKKDDSIKKLSELYPNDIEDIEKIMDLSTKFGTKYIPFLEKATKEFIVDSDVDIDDYVNLLENRIRVFHRNVDRITPDVIASVKELYDGVESKTFPNLDKVIKQPKDINSYTVKTLYYLSQALQMIQSNKEKERTAKKDVKKIYDDGDTMIVEPMSHVASCYYGAGTKWCTTMQDPGYYNKYTSSGNLYYIIDKNNRRQKLALYVNKDGKTEVYDTADKLKTVAFLFHVYPEVTEFVSKEILGGGEIKQGLEKILAGKVGRWSGDRIDPTISLVEELPNGDYQLQLDLNDSEHDFYKLFDIDEESSDSFYINMVYSVYSDFDFIDSYSSEEDWREGYVFSYMNDEQLGRLRQYIKILNPILYECLSEEKMNDYNSNCKQDIAEYLQITFNSDVESIISELTYDKNRDIAGGIKEYLENNFENVFEEYGLPMTGSVYHPKVKVSDLIKTYEKYDPMFTMSIYGLLKTIVDTEKIYGPDISDRIYEFSETGYEYGDTSRAFDRLLDDMEEEIGSIDVDSVNQSYELIKKIGGINNWIKMPGDSRFMIKIEDIDTEDNRITFLIQNKQGKTKKMRLPFENFKDFIYNQSLFEK